MTFSSRHFTETSFAKYMVLYRSISQTVELLSDFWILDIKDSFKLCMKFQDEIIPETFLMPQ